MVAFLINSLYQTENLFFETLKFVVQGLLNRHQA